MIEGKPRRAGAPVATTHGIAFGFIAYTALKILSGKLGELSPMVAIIAVLFVFKFAFLG